MKRNVSVFDFCLARNTIISHGRLGLVSAVTTLSTETAGFGWPCCEISATGVLCFFLISPNRQTDIQREGDGKLKAIEPRTRASIQCCRRYPDAKDEGDECWLVPNVMWTVADEQSDGINQMALFNGL
ncbi:hypothetical protein CBL_04582 [Carabus blaptoides fortunei]